MDYSPAYVKNKNVGFAEFCLNLRTMDYGKIKCAAVQKLPNYGPHLIACERPFVPFYYDDPFLCRLPAIDVMMPTFSVHSWDLETGRLELNFMEEDVNVKIQLLQHYVLKAVVAHQREWIGRDDLTYETACEIFQPFIQHDRFVIYLPNGRQKKQLWISEKGVWKYGTNERSFLSGQIVRPVLKLQGLCFIIMGGNKLKFRIQHQTVTVSIFA